MKKNRYILMLAAAVAAAACSQTELQDPGETGVVIPSNAFGAGMENSTKVTIQSDYSLKWDAGDGVAVWDGTSYSEYTASSSAAWTTLTGAEVNTELAHYAFYPYSDDLSFEDGEVTAVIPDVQTPVKGNFPYNPSVAYAAAGEKNFAFYNVCGLVGFEITKENISNVVIFGNNGENLTGKVTVPCNSTAPAATVVEGVKSVTLQAESVFEKGVYYVAVLPQEFTKGITITMNGTDGSQDKKDSKPFTLNRSYRINANKIDEGDFEDVNEISNAAELQAFFNVVNADENKGAGMTARLVADIDMSGIKLVPAAEFAGTFDGSYLDGTTTKNHVISNWNTTTALFGKVAATGVVKNVTVNGAYTINATDDAAFIALDNAGTISYCTTQGTMTTLPDLTFSTERAVGAVAARTTGTIAGCINEAVITVTPSKTTVAGKATPAGRQLIGGIAGVASLAEGASESAKIQDCINSAQVSYTSEGEIVSMSLVGGILGGTPSTVYSSVYSWTPANHVAITGCTNEASANVTFGYKTQTTANAYNNILVGGVAGYVEGTIASSHNRALIKIDGYKTTDDQSANLYVKNSSVAGVAGVVTGNATDCTNSGTIDFSATITGGDATAEYIGCAGAAAIGGVFAKTGNGNTISRCANSGNMIVDFHMRKLNGSAGHIGGVVGSSYAKLESCTCGVVNDNRQMDLTTRTKTTYIGGVAGYQDKYSVTACKNYADILVDGGDANVNVGTANQSQTTSIGGIVGHTRLLAFTISGCENEGDITYEGGNTSGRKYVAGILANQEVYADEEGEIITITGNCKNTGTMTVNSRGAVNVAGILARAKKANVDGATNSGAIIMTSTSTAYTCAAGVLGHIEAAGTVSNLTNEATGVLTISNDGVVNAGGVISYYVSPDAVSGLINKAEINIVKGKGASLIGGVVGYDKQAKIESASNSGDLIITSLVNGQIGGIVGLIDNTVSDDTKTDANRKIIGAILDSENSGNISVVNSTGWVNVGGFAGGTKTGNIDKATCSSVINVNCTGNVAAGGIVGEANNTGAPRILSGSYTGSITVVSNGANCHLSGGIAKHNGQVKSFTGKADLSIRTGGASTWLGGLAGVNGAAQFAGSSYTGNITYEYTGTGTPAVYAGLVSGQQKTAPVVNGKFGGKITLTNVPDGADVRCGALCGDYYASSASSQDITWTLGAATLLSNIEVNGVAISDVETDPSYFKNTGYLYGVIQEGDSVVADALKYEVVQ